MGGWIMDIRVLKTEIKNSGGWMDKKINAWMDRQIDGDALRFTQADGSIEIG